MNKLSSVVLTALFTICLATSACAKETRNSKDTSNYETQRRTKVEELAEFLKKKGSIVLDEAFEDQRLAQRGWYDAGTENASVVVDVNRNSYVLEVTFQKGKEKPVNGPLRHVFPVSDLLFIRYWIKYDHNWEWTGRNYGPHEFYLLTNGNNRWVGPARTRLTFYVEANNGRPRLAIQDAENIDVRQIKKDLTEISESRSVAGCNGSRDQNPGSCYQSGKVWLNGKSWTALKANLRNQRWHQVEVLVKMNSIQQGEGVPDGVLAYWLDGVLVLQKNMVLFRTGAQADLQFNQVLFGPWFHGGAPHDQRFWVDDLLIRTANQ